MKQCVRDANTLVFTECEESQLYREFLKKWDNSWGKEELPTENVPRVQRLEPTMPSKMFSSKSKTYIDVCSNSQHNLLEIVQEVRASLGKKKSDLKFRYFILSVIVRELSIKDI